MALNGFARANPRWHGHCRNRRCWNTTGKRLLTSFSPLRAVSNAIGGDVYEYEKGIFFYDRSDEDLNDTMLQKLMSYSNVLITPHQAFATKEALTNIAKTTFQNLNAFKNGNSIVNEITTVPIQILS